VALLPHPQAPLLQKPPLHGVPSAAVLQVLVGWSQVWHRPQEETHWPFVRVWQGPQVGRQAPVLGSQLCPVGQLLATQTPLVESQLWQALQVVWQAPPWQLSQGPQVDLQVPVAGSQCWQGPQLTGRQRPPLHWKQAGQPLACAVILPPGGGVHGRGTQLPFEHTCPSGQTRTHLPSEQHSPSAAQGLQVPWRSQAWQLGQVVVVQMPAWQHIPSGQLSLQTPLLQQPPLVVHSALGIQMGQPSTSVQQAPLGHFKTQVGTWRFFPIVPMSQHSPGWHCDQHSPWTHSWQGPQTWAVSPSWTPPQQMNTGGLQPPQLRGSLCVFTQCPSQQVGVSCGQTLPQAPQFNGSLRRLTQPSGHSVGRSPGQTHLRLSQTTPGGH
jgi:hypothetical protein